MTVEVGELRAVFDNAEERERSRLEAEIVEAAKVLDQKFQWYGDFAHLDAAIAYDAFKRTMQKLRDFETKLNANVFESPEA